MEDKNSSRWVYPPNCRTKVGARWSPSFPRQSLARRRARNIVQVHAHALNGSWECYHVVRIGLGAIWGDHGRRRSLHFTTPHFCLKRGWVYPLCPFLKNKSAKGRPGNTINPALSQEFNIFCEQEQLQKYATLDKHPYCVPGIRHP